MFKNGFGQVRSGWLIAFALLMVFIGQGIFSFPGILLASTIEVSKGQAEISLESGNMSPCTSF